jgi:hypothetical protein
MHVGTMRATSVTIAMKVGTASRIGFEQLQSAADADADAACSTCDVGLVAHYTLDEDTGSVAPERIAMHDGTTMGNTAWDPAGGVVGGALNLLGSGYVRADWAVEQFLMSEVTAALWVKLDPTSPPDARFMSSYYFNGTSNGVFEMDAGSFGLVCKFFVGGTWRNLFTPDAVPVAAWHHLACVYTGAAVIAYLDGIELDRLTASGTIAATETLPFAIGTSIFPNDDTQNRMIGLVDDVRLYDRALTPAELVLLATPP